MNHPYMESQDPIDDDCQSPPTDCDNRGNGHREEAAHVERPTKIQKHQHPHTSSSFPTHENEQKQTVLDSDCFVRIYGFSPSEFLPLIPKPPREVNPTLCQILCQDLLGKCLFGGYLKTSETIRLATVSKGFQAMARTHVQSLDLSRLPNITSLTVKRIVTRYPNLKVRV